MMSDQLGKSTLRAYSDVGMADWEYYAMDDRLWEGRTLPFDMEDAMRDEFIERNDP